jgi:hypothetical protein
MAPFFLSDHGSFFTQLFRAAAENMNEPMPVQKTRQAAHSARNKLITIDRMSKAREARFPFEKG